MANLKLDLLNKLKNDKYYEELELIRLAQEPNMNYKEKINTMSDRLKNLAIVNSQMGLVEQYFNEPEQPQNNGCAPVNVEQPPASNGQSHAE